MIHQFKVYIMTFNDGVIEHLVNCADNLSAIIILNSSNRYIRQVFVFVIVIVFLSQNVKERFKMARWQDGKMILQNLDTRAGGQERSAFGFSRPPAYVREFAKTPF